MARNILVGDILNAGGAEYTVVDISVMDLARRGPTRMLTLRGRCVECGAPHTFARMADFERLSPNRRCDEHKAPLVRARKSKFFSPSRRKARLFVREPNVFD